LRVVFRMQGCKVDAPPMCGFVWFVHVNLRVTVLNRKQTKVARLHSLRVREESCLPLRSLDDRTRYFAAFMWSA
jgi:hypothetical protein